MSTQDPNKWKGNQKSTDTSNIAPGDPMWTTGDDHNQQSFGWGYDYHEPVSFLKGNLKEGGYVSGNANIRFGKFQIPFANRLIPVEHGSVIDFPIERVEGTTGRYQVKIRERWLPTPVNGVLGTIDDVTQHQYGVCKSDIDLWTLNRPYASEDEKRWRESKGYYYIPGLSWDSWNRELTLTFESGEKVKKLKIIAPYRAEVKELQPATLRHKQTYYIQEYNAVRANTYAGNYYEQTGSNISGYSIAGHANDDTSRITNHWHYYYCLTLPMPRAWIENIVGNYTYIDNWDQNYKYRVVNNTERDRFEPNRPDDDTDADAETRGYITRYDHTGKMNLVKGKTRFSRFALRRKGSGRWSSKNRHDQNANGHGSIIDGTDETWSGVGTFTSVDESSSPKVTSTAHAACDVWKWLAKPTKHNTWHRYSWYWCNNQQADTVERREYTYPDDSNTSFIDVPSNAKPNDFHYKEDTLNPQNCAQRWVGQQWYNARNQTNPNRDPGNYYSGNWSRNWISNDARITHRYHPEFPNCAMIGILGLKRDIINGRIDGNAGQGTSSLDHWDVQKRRLFPRVSAETNADWEQRWIPLPRSTANGVRWNRSLSPACPTLKYINEYNHNNPTDYDEFYGGSQYSEEDTHPETPWNAFVGHQNHTWGVIPYEDQSWYESSRLDMDSGDPQTNGNAMFSAPLPKAAITGTVGEGTWLYTGTPKDRIFNYGNPATGAGDLAQVMFNNHGALSADFAPFGTILGATYVMSAEDPSCIRDQYDYPSNGGAFDNTAVELFGGDAQMHYYEKKYYEYFHCHRENPNHRQELTVNWSNSQFPNLGGWHGVGTDLGDWTSRWITDTRNSLVSAGKLEAADHPLTVKNPDNSDNDYFAGYQWDDTKSFDTSRGTGIHKTGGFGSAGHGEGGTSRYLWDHHHMVHPLSSYEKNSTNLKGFYTTCIDHVDRVVELELVKVNLDDEYDIGNYQSRIEIMKNGVIVVPEYWANYDFRVLADHFISPGNTYQDNDGWESAPTANSLNLRLFSAGPAGSMLCDPADPVLFLGVSAGNLPGGTPTSRTRVIPPRPAKIRIEGADSDTKNVYAGGLVTQPALVSDNNYQAILGAANCAPVTNGKCVGTAFDTKTYKFTFKNVGEKDCEVFFGNTYESFFGPYQETDAVSDLCPPGCGAGDEAKGDKLDDWSAADQVIKGAIDGDGNPLLDSNGDPTYRTGQDGFVNTVSLSANETALVEYTVACHTGNKLGYWLAHNYTIDYLDGTTRAGRTVFRVGAKA